MAEKTDKKKKPVREGAWWRKYTKEFLDEPQPVQAEPQKAQRRTPRAEMKISPITFQFGGNFEDAANLQKQMDSIFKNIFSRSLFALPRLVKLNEGIFRKPAIEVRDLGREIAVRAEMPGVKKEDIKIHIEGRNLILDAHSQKKHEKQSETAQSFSQSFSGFRNIIRLPAEVEKKSVRAKYESGILTIILQKKESSEGGDVEIE